jgi:hypothetical protein
VHKAGSAAIGINDDDANAHFAIDSARKRARAAQRGTDSRASKVTALAARTEYFAGTDDVAFAAAITVSGLPLTFVPGTISLGVAQSPLAVEYGLPLDRTHAEVLTEKVVALKEQVVKAHADRRQRHAHSFGIPPATATT